MLDKLKPAWGVYKCQQSLQSLSIDEIAGLLEEAEYDALFYSRQWPAALFSLLMIFTCC